MATVDDIKEMILSVSEYFDKCLADFGRFEITYYYAKRFARAMREKGAQEALEDFANGKLPDCEESYNLNTYPFGKRTHHLYPEFLGVCEGKRRLHGLFKAMARQIECHRQRSHRNPDWKEESKCITIFTDKWDATFLRMYEALFLDAILNYNFTFKFFLVTDYGITKIPFMDEYQTNWLKDTFRGQEIEHPLSLHELMEKHGLFSARFDSSIYHSFDVCRQKGASTSIFRFMDLTYSYCDSHGKKKHGRIKEIYAKKFLKAVNELIEDGGIRETYRSTGGEFCDLDFGSISFSWCNDQTDGQPAAERMVAALREMIANLK